MYRLVYRLASRAAEWVPITSGPFAAARRGRRESPARWAAWAAAHRPTGPIIWVHAASVGEALVAEPVVRRLMHRVPRLTVVHSFTSPSAIRAPGSFPAAFRDYLPPDRPGPVAVALDAVRPAVLTHVRGELWPELIRAAHARGISQVVVGGMVRPRSLRLHWPVRSLYAPVLPAVSWLGAVSPEDATCLVRLGADPTAVEMTGDPRHDHLIERARSPETPGALSDWARRGRALVAGSVEREDEPVVLEAAHHLLAQDPTVSVAIVPHDPDPPTVARITARAQALGVQVAPWGPDDSAPSAARVVIVAARGLLFELYRSALAAYVGGGFRRGRLHAAIEPAVHGVPLVIGPRWHGAADAAALLEAGGAVALPRRTAAAALADTWGAWYRDERARDAAGKAARGTLQAGAAEKTAKVILRLLGG